MNSAKKNAFLLSIFMVGFVISTVWAVIMTTQYNQNYAYIQVGKEVVRSAVNIQQVVCVRNVENCTPKIRQDVGDKLVDFILSIDTTKFH